jgi:prepilin-type N-terminal cleavage/methylation domain-containing protein
MRREAMRMSGSKGFSLVELMMVIVITTIGFLALINMQVGTLHAVNESRSMMEAVNLAEHFVETLKSAAIAWNGAAAATILQGGLAAKFPHLRYVGNAALNGGSGWIEGYRSTASDRRVGPLGNADATWDSGISNEVLPELNKRYCLHYRLTWLVPDYLMRADVRVLWLRDEAKISLYKSCGVGTEMQEDMSNVGSVTMPATIMRNVFAQ